MLVPRSLSAEEQQLLEYTAPASSPWWHLWIPFWLGPTFGEGRLGPCAVHLIQPDGITSPAKASRARGCDCRPAAQLPTHHLGMVQVPAVITHCPPLLLMKHLDPSGATVWAVHQPKHHWVWNKEGYQEPFRKGWWRWFWTWDLTQDCGSLYSWLLDTTPS